MEKTYTLNLKTVDKYCLYDMHNQYYFYEGTDTIAHKFHSNVWHSDHERYIEILHDKFPDFKEHIGTLFYIISINYEPHYNSMLELLFDSTVYEELNRLYFLKKLLEDGDSRLNKVDVIVNHRSINPMDSDFVSSNLELNKILIEDIFKTSKDYFMNSQEFYYANLLSELHSGIDITAQGLLKIRDRFKRNAVNYKSMVINSEKEMIENILDYLNNETNLNPKNKKMPKELGIIIYYLLLIFRIVTKQETDESRMAAYIRDAHKNPMRSLK